MRWRLRNKRGPGDSGDAELDARLSVTWEAAAMAVGKMLDLRSGKEALLTSSELLQEAAADLPAAAGTTRRGASRSRGRLALGSVAGVAAALAAAAVALVAVQVPDARHHETQQAITAAYVVKRVDDALIAAGRAEIAQLTVTASGTVTPGGTNTPTTAREWSYGDQWRSVTYSATGHPVYDDGIGTSSIDTVVSYQTRTWARQPGLRRPAKLAPGQHGCKQLVAALPWLFQPALPGVSLIGSSVSPLPTATALRTAISCGALAMAGRQRIDGIEAIELTSRPGSPLSETIWANPHTYLPARVVVRLAFGNAVLQRTADITWLRPTPQNLARLTVPIPAGFRQVPFLRAIGPIRQIPVGTAPTSRGL
jgi:hypothetical protein